MIAGRGRLMLCCSLYALSVWDGAAAQSAAPASPPMPAQGQPAQTPPPKKSGDRSDIGKSSSVGRQSTDAASASAVGETIVVTATRRVQRLERTPEAVTAFTDERRNLIGVQNGQDIVNLTPSAALQGEYLTIRGVGRFEDPGQGTDPGIGVNVDGVYTSSPAYLGQPDFLTDRVEIIPGPQSITGRESAGGDVNIYSRRPTDQYHADIRFGGTTFDEGYSDAAFSGPITDNLKFRLAEAYDVTGGNGPENTSSQALDQQKQPGRGDSLLLEGQLEWDPTDDLNIWARYQNFQQHFNQFDGVGFGVGLDSPYLTSNMQVPNPKLPAVSTLFFGLAPNPQFGLPGGSNPGLTDPFKTNLDAVGHSDIHDDHTVTLQATYDLHGAILKYTGGYSQYTAQNLSDVDNTARQSYALDGVVYPSSYVANSPAQKHWYSNELTLSSSTSDRFRWVVGAYDYGENYVTGFAVEDPFATYLSKPLTNGIYTPAAPNPSRAIYDQTTTLATESEAIYGQLEYDVTPTLRATGAFRYNWDERQGADVFRDVYAATTAGIGIDFTPGTGAIPGRNYGYSQAAYKNETGKVVLDWHPDKTLIAYGIVARGYEPGGFNLGAFSTIPSVQSETLMDYELGVKKTVNTKLILNASAYYYQYNDLQVPVYTAENLPGIKLTTGKPDIISTYAQNLVNAQRARSYGLELSSVVSPTDDLHLTFLYSYLNSELEEFKDTQPNQEVTDISTRAQYADLRGGAIPFSPKNKFTFSPQYVVHFQGGDLSLSAIYTYVGSQFDGVFKNQNYHTAQYENLNLRALYQPTKTPWTFILYARNVTNSTQFIYHEPSIYYPQLQTAYTVNPPFAFGGEVQYRF